jgi:hypothetical protein
MLIQTAHELRVQRLFHYQRFKIDWLNQIIFDRNIHFSNPADFNDPWDCHLHFHIPPADDLAGRERLIDWLARAYRRQFEGHQLADMDRVVSQRATQLRENPLEIETMVPQLSESITNVVLKEYRLYCLSTKPTSTLMWSHYSNNHKGVCLEFSCDNHLFGVALKIQYGEEYPLLDVTDNTIESGLLPLCSKSSAWSYEDEYRVIAQEKSGVFPGLRTRRNFLKYPIGALRAVIMGCMIPPADANELRKIISKQFSRDLVKLKRAVRMPNRYSLSIEEDR